jgi:hypothetical protein
MPRICPISLKVWDIYGTTMTHMRKIICFSITGYYIVFVPNIILHKIFVMAKLSGPLSFTGKLQDISAYTMKGCEGTVLRMGWGPSKKDIQTKDCYEITRKNITEFGGRSTTGAFIKRVLFPLQKVVDYRISPVLNGLLKPAQEEDRESAFGQRNVLISRKPFLLEGLNLNRRNSFDAVISTPVSFELDKTAGKALITIPELMPSVNFFPPPNFSICRTTAILGVVPDFYYAAPKYKPFKNFDHWMPAMAHSEWFRTESGSPSITMELSAPHYVSGESFSLLLAVALEVGRPTITGEIMPLRYNGCGKICAVR